MLSADNTMLSADNMVYPWYQLMTSCSISWKHHVIPPCYQLTMWWNMVLSADYVGYQLIRWFYQLIPRCYQLITHYVISWYMLSFFLFLKHFTTYLSGLSEIIELFLIYSIQIKKAVFLSGNNEKCCRVRTLISTKIFLVFTPMHISFDSQYIRTLVLWELLF
jgi:hypothetical protein